MAIEKYNTGTKAENECKHICPGASMIHLGTKYIWAGATCTRAGAISEWVQYVTVRVQNVSIQPPNASIWAQLYIGMFGFAMADHIRGACISPVTVRTLVWFPLLFSEISCSWTF